MFLLWDKNGDIKISDTKINGDFYWCKDSNLKCKGLFFTGKCELQIAYENNVSDDEIFIPDTFRYEQRYYNELLKSCLQKSVRLRKVDTALRMAWQLIRQDFTKFIRRIINIIAEDAIIHPKMLHCVWMMVAETKGWKVTTSQILLLLNIIRDITDSEYHEVILTETKWMPNNIDIIVKDDSSILSQLCILQTNGDSYEKYVSQACLSIIIRVCYGGMKTDMVFMKALITLWLERLNKLKSKDNKIVDEGKEWKKFIETNAYNTDTSKWSNNFELLEIRDVDKLDVAVDFHCYGKEFFNKIRKKMTETKNNGGFNFFNNFKKYSDLEIKKAIWYNRSSLYTKVYPCKFEEPLLFNPIDINERIEKQREIYKDLYNEIKPHLSNISSEYWQCQFSSNKNNKRKREITNCTITIDNYFKKVKPNT